MRNVAIGPYVLNAEIDRHDCTAFGFGAPPDRDPYDNVYSGFRGSETYIEVVKNVNLTLGIQAVYGVLPVVGEAKDGRILIQLGADYFDMRQLLEAAEARRDALAAGAPISSLLADPSAMRRLTNAHSNTN